MKIYSIGTRIIWVDDDENSVFNSETATLKTRGKTIAMPTNQPILISEFDDLEDAMAAMPELDWDGYFPYPEIPPTEPPADDFDEFEIL